MLFYSIPLLFQCLLSHVINKVYLTRTSNQHFQGYAQEMFRNEFKQIYGRRYH